MRAIDGENSEQKKIKDDMISRQAAIDVARKSSVKEVTPAYMLIDKAEVMTELMMLPPAQSDLIAKIQNGIKVTDADDAYSCGMRNGMRWCMSLVDGKEPLFENCPSIQPDSKTRKEGGNNND